MQNDDLDRAARSLRVQAICRRLTALVSMSREKRREVDRLLTELDAITRESVLVMAAGASRSTSRG
jgi:hypothetical protein